MTNSQQLSNRFKEVFLDGTWVANTNYQLTLAGISLEQATTIIADLNSIWLLTCHINYYVAGVLQVFNGGTLDIRDKYSFDFEPPTTETQWQNMISDLMQNAEAFAKHVENMSEEQLQSAFVKEDYGNYQRNIDGMIEHAYYHLGQILLIKKMVNNRL